MKQKSKGGNSKYTPPTRDGTLDCVTPTALTEIFGCGNVEKDALSRPVSPREQQRRHVI
jgi:hypothetical protein